MSGFSSLLNQFKQTTQQAAASGSIATSRGGAATDTPSKRPRSIFESNSSSSDHHHPQSTRQKYSHPQSTTNSNVHQKKQQYRFPSTPVRTIYIACPAFAETGGPEALHQLCHMINTGDYGYDDSDDAKPKCDEFGRAIAAGSKAADGKKGSSKNAVKAYMLYLRERHGGREVEEVLTSRARSTKYDRYDAPPAENLPGNTSNNETTQNDYSPDLVIWPECWTHLIDSLQPDHTNEEGRYRYQIAIWWLSVNNNKGRFDTQQFSTRNDILHLVQSTYARDYVSSKISQGTNNNRGKVSTSSGDGRGAGNVMMLTEFIPYSSPSFSPKIPNEEDKTQEVARDLDVVYNTAKGMHYTDEIIRRACGKKAKTNATDGSVCGGGIKFNPIGKGEGGRERMTGEEVVALLKRSKVYIDFGPHPGMDRLPREAALAGCVVVTNREGAANFTEDVPLPAEFKLGGKFDVDKVSSLLKDICNNHAKYADKMKPYQKWILGQEKQMEVCVDRLVDKVVTRRIVKKRQGVDNNP